MMKAPKFLRTIAPFFLLALASACGGSDSEPDEPGGTGNPASGGDTPRNQPAAPSSTSGECAGSELFSRRPYGTDGDLIRHIELDPASGDVFFGTLTDIYRVPASGGEPALVAARPDDAQPIYGGFAVRDGRILLPASGGFSDVGRLPVLWALPLQGGAAEPIVTQVGASDEVLMRSYMDRAFIWNDDVVWMDSKGSLGQPDTNVYHARRTPWEMPGEPVEWYTSSERIYGAIISGTTAFVNQDAENEAVGRLTQKIVDMTTGEVAAENTVARYGAWVLAADDESLILNHDDVDDLENLGVYRVAPDGSGRQKIGGFTIRVTTSNNSQNFVHRDGEWAFHEINIEANRLDIFTYAVGADRQYVGCVEESNDTTIHSIAIADSALYVAIADGSVNATVLRMDR